METRYSPQQIRALAWLIESHFDLARLRAAVQVGLATALEHYSQEHSLPAVILTLCIKVNEQGDIHKLVSGLKQRNPNVEMHNALSEFENAHAAAAVGDVLLLRKIPRLMLVNRSTLRNHIEQLTLPGSGYRAISVSGPQACGKTHTREVIRFVAEGQGFHHVPVDVVDDTRARSLREVMEKITLGMRRTYRELADLLPDDPSEARAAERFVDWIGGFSQGFVMSGEQYWLTFDGLDRPGAAPTRENLIPVLLNAVNDNTLRNTRIFLLGDNGKRVRTAKAVVLHEQATGLSVDEIRQFIVSYAAKAGYRLPDADLAEMVDHVVGSCAWPFDHQSMEGIGERMETVLDQIDSVRAVAAGPHHGGSP